MQHVRGRGEVYTGFKWRNLRERDHLKDPGVNGRIKLKYYLREIGGRGMD